MKHFKTQKEAKSYYGMTWNKINKKFKVTKCYDFNTGGQFKSYLIQNK